VWVLGPGSCVACSRLVSRHTYVQVQVTPCQSHVCACVCVIKCVYESVRTECDTLLSISSDAHHPQKAPTQSHTHQHEGREREGGHCGDSCGGALVCENSE
jgi:hypothetical protein